MNDAINEEKSGKTVLICPHLDIGRVLEDLPTFQGGGQEIKDG
jgi:hypothetical protein